MSKHNTHSRGHFHEKVWRPDKNPGSDDYNGIIISDEKFPENVEKFKMLTSLDDITSLRLWKAVAVEILGTLILVLVGCGSCIQKWQTDLEFAIRLDDTAVYPSYNYSSTDIVQIALAFGLGVSTVVWIIGHVSGGHINPAVTCAMLITRRISLARGFLYIVGQLFGAIAGAGILKFVTPTERQGSLGCTLISPGVNYAMCVGVEFCISFILVLTVFASCDKRRKDLGGSFPLTIGMSVTMCHLFAVKYTGSSMNPARSYGPAVVMGMWTDHWVYWVGPILGGVLAGLLYDVVFASNASVEKCRGCLFARQYNSESYRAKKLKIRILEEEEDYETK
ncbi:hypothetical protein CHS0354_023399 [Potamilus streckersoni]|uniref:Uncharacterized protein n=1 Tax=Potamilus streckersoni TaxID=2493646 RepID=A0AAE0TB72_9BIVA|nr:hypothetical protein CHS0354_023399 [Potamilus streckersoni]